MQVTVTAAEIATLLDHAPASANILSLDCFDTLVWRNAHIPRDVFCDLPLQGGGIEARAWAESGERRARKVVTGQSEVTLDQIYRRMMPAADDAAIADAIARECAAEARHCYGFAPVADVMRAAKAKGWRIIIVSDTYLTETQLRALIGAAAGEDVLALIDRVFASSAYGVSKSEGLFRHVLADLKVAPATILHLGDNHAADQVAPTKLGIGNAHFRQFAPDVEQRLRHEASAATMIEPGSRVTIPINQPHRAALALRPDLDPALALGHDVLGPVLQTFARWVKDEAEAMALRVGKPVRPVFLMRDGYLPRAVFDAMYPEAGSAAVEISRFTAGAAHLTDRDTLDAFVTETLQRMPLEPLGRQLLLHGNEIGPLTKGDERAFRKAVLAPDMTRRILKRAAGYCDRLIAHIRAQGIADGDAIMLVDLGYNGSVQTLIEPLLRTRMNLTVSGRYLLLREKQSSGFDKAGLLDQRNYDTRMLHAMCMCVAVIEQLCTVAQGSAVDYTAEGMAIRKDAGIKGAQSDIRDAVQAACVAFATGPSGMVRPAVSDDADARRRMAAACLARLMFLPSAEEVALFEAFDHDVNMGTDQVVRLLDSDAAGTALQQRGLGYIATTGRMFIPGELQRHGLPLNLSLFAANRFALDLRNRDFEVGGVPVPVILADATEHHMANFTAYPTTDGYYRVTVPIGAGLYTAAIQLGALCEWVQVGSTRFVEVRDTTEFKGEIPSMAATAIPDAMTQAGPGLFQAAPNGLLMVPPPGRSRENLALELVFRPVVWRNDQAAAEQQQAA